LKTRVTSPKSVLCILLLLAISGTLLLPTSMAVAGTPDWPLQLVGAATMNMTQAEFESLASLYPVGWDDNTTGNLWDGVALWRLVALVDDGDNTTFSDALASAGYNVRVIGADDYSYTFPSEEVARNDNFILANELNGAPLPTEKYPLKLVNLDFEVGGPSVSQVVRIELQSTTPTHPVPDVAEWPIQLYGALSDNLTQAEFEAGVLSYGLSCTDNTGTWTGLALWRLVALVDDDDPATFNSVLAVEGYSIKVSAPDYYYVFDSAGVAGNDNIIAANALDGQPLPLTDPTNPSKLWYPLKLVGSGLHSGDRVGGVVMIELLNLPEPTPDEPEWDLNGDHVCNIGDVVVIGLKWGRTGSDGWIPEDLNSDGTINIGDVVVVGLHWGGTW
jgi:DMSO/TMAO reductase YedYZ molybdopterin-dependent catalytic subunit